MGKLNKITNRMVKARIRNREQMEQALELKKAGATYKAIGEQLGFTAQRAHQLVEAALGELNERMMLTAATVRRMEIERLDAILLAHWRNRGNPRNADTILRAMDRRAKLLGLDAPTLVAPTMPDGSAMPPALDLSKLSTDQLEALEAIYQTCAVDPAPDAEPTPEA